LGDFFTNASGHPEYQQPEAIMHAWSGGVGHLIRRCWSLQNQAKKVNWRKEGEEDHQDFGHQKSSVFNDIFNRKICITIKSTFLST
jgi:hypothetical protein